ncbi:MAG: DnaB-like helicase C-terminal domain-containing protein [Nitrososphaerales archaeon]
MNSVVQFVEENQLGKFKIRGDELELPCPITSCPNKGEYQFYLNTRTEAYYCQRCGTAGKTLKSLAFKLGIIKLNTEVPQNNIVIPFTDIEKYQKSLFLCESAYSYLTNKRGFKPSTIKQFKLGQRDLYNQSVITIPYFDKNGVCVGMKYDFYHRTGEEKYQKEKGSKTELFNLSKVNNEFPVYVTEGEYDAMTLWQTGYTNVCSLPNGAMGLNGYLETITQAPEYIVCFDSDTAGQEAVQKFSKALGLSKCKLAVPKLKDFNEYLQCGLPSTDIKDIVDSAVPMFHAPIEELSVYRDSVLEYLKDPIKVRGVSTGWNSIDAVWGGVRSGEVTSLSGLTGAGKTTFALALATNQLKNGKKVLIVSPEMNEEILLLDMINGYFHDDVQDEKRINEFESKFKDKIYIAKVFDTWTDKSSSTLLTHVFDIVEYAIRYYQVDFIILDHMRLLINKSKNEKESERVAIDDFLEKSVHTAIYNNVHIVLIVQPKNILSTQKKLTEHDLKGSSNIGQDSHNILLIHREKNSKNGRSLVELDIAKNRRLGKVGTIVLEFDLNSRNNYLEN